MSSSEATLPVQGSSWFWKEVTPDVRAALSEEQQKAVEAAVARSTDDAERADVRLHFGKFYVRILAGKERRNPERIKKETAENPVFVKKNFLVIGIYWVLMLFTLLYAWALLMNLIRLMLI